MRRGVVLGVVGLALVLAAGVGVLVDPSALRVGHESSIWPSLLAGLGAAALLFAAWSERAGLRRAMAARQTRFGAFAVVYTFAVLIALAAIAFLVERQAWRWDLTHDQRGSLDEDTLRVLRSIPEGGAPVEVVGFVAGGGLTPIDRAAAQGELGPLFELLQRHDSRIQASFADAAREPALARTLGIARVPSVAVRWQAPGEEQPRVVRTDLLSEAEVARAIEEALLGEKRPAYVLHGHGEASPVDVEGGGGFFRAMMAIAADNYDVRPLSLIEAREVPEDASLLLVAGPVTDFVPTEIAALRRFVRSGGRLALLLGPSFERSGRVLAQPVLEDWLRADFGLKLDDSVICDIEGLSGPRSDLRSLLVPPTPAAMHPILAGRDRLLVMPFSRPLRLAAERPHGVSAEILLRSGPRSWAEAETPGLPAYDPADERGPHGLVAALSVKPHDQETAARLLVVGSHAFANNSTLSLAGNASFLLDVVAWLNERESVLDARRHRGRDGTAVIAHQQGVLILVCAAAIPLVLALFGGLIWWHRRRL